jgi:arylsulfatase A-like enzyme
MRIDYRLAGCEPTSAGKYNSPHMKAIVIVANGWHAGWLGSYGNEWLRTHNLDRLAAESVLFDQHFAVQPTPNQWFDSIASARYSRGTSLLASLRRYGVRTVRVHDLKGQSPANAALHWDESIAVPKDSGGTPGEAIYLQIDQTLQGLADVDNWLLWIETDRFVPPWDVSLDFFDEYAQDMAFLDEGEEPYPWDEPPIGSCAVTDREFERLQSTYASVVTEWDVELAEWFELFREQKLDESAIWMVTAGHGLSLGEHGWIGPSGQRPFAELGHVPLILRLPHAEQAGRRVASQTASIDVLPTQLDAFAAPGANSVHGKSLLPLARGARAPIHPYICQSLSVDERTERAIRTPEWACFHSSSLPRLLFRKPEDRWEVNDLRQQHLEWSEHLEAVAKDHAANPDAPPQLRPYDEVMANETKEADNEHGASGKRDNGSSKSEGGLRGHQGDQED